MRSFIFLTILTALNVNSFAQCETFDFAIIGVEPAYCRTSSVQSGNGVVYASATGGTPSYAYLWTDLQTGSTTVNTTWGGKNPGFYKIQITDQIGCVLIDTVEVDSINPVANFNIISSDLDGSLIGNAPVNLLALNTSTGVAWIGDPLDDDPIHWKLGNDVSYTPSWDVYAPANAATFNSESVQEICLAIENSNGCKDTLCKYITVNGYADILELEFDVKIFPNPANNAVTISGIDENSEILFTDLQGKVIYRIVATNSVTTFDVSNSERGIYLIQVKSASDIVTKKIVLQ